MAVVQANMDFANKIVKASALLLIVVIITVFISQIFIQWSEPGFYWLPLKTLPFLYFPWITFKKLGKGVLLNVFLIWLNIFISMGFFFKYYIWLFL
ncbi:MAG: hypothetical protein ACJ75J_06665 [Cytophagaceae bacterium]